ncbi:MAG: AAA family ATPase [Pseudomonadales bacterium]|nr:AAA family ATPase [Pseudomonadales bacterium]
MTRTLVDAFLAQCQGSLIETHISWVILTDSLVYKIKKPLDLGFLDYHTLALRRHYCEEELRLNRRTAPQIYDSVVAFRGTESNPQLSDDPDAPDVIEYAVKMHRFSEDAILGRMEEKGKLSPIVVAALAEAIAGFHGSLSGVEMDPATARALVIEPCRENFAQITHLAQAEAQEQDTVTRLAQWTETTFVSLTPAFEERAALGMIRDCHGDLHLGNMLFDGQQCVLFDCIEFNPGLHRIDIISDVAFTIMDMTALGKPDLAWRLLNDWLTLTGDYDGLRVLRFYLVYRAMVRAKVSLISASQATGDSAQSHERAVSAYRQFQTYLTLAEAFSTSTAANNPAVTGAPALILMCGFSGSGKSTIATELASQLGYIHLRSDVERKRLFRLAPDESSHDAGLDIYQPQASRQTRERLQALAALCLNSQFGVIADATFISRSWREPFLTLARQSQVPVVIIHCQVSATTASKRLAARQGDPSEAGFAQYLDQQKTFDDFSLTEQQLCITVNTEDAEALATLQEQVRLKLKGADTASKTDLS